VEKPEPESFNLNFPKQARLYINNLLVFTAILEPVHRLQAAITLFVELSLQ